MIMSTANSVTLAGNSSAAPEVTMHVNDALGQPRSLTYTCACYRSQRCFCKRMAATLSAQHCSTLPAFRQRQQVQEQAGSNLANPSVHICAQSKPAHACIESYQRRCSARMHSINVSINVIYSPILMFPFPYRPPYQAGVGGCQRPCSMC